jgi:DNA repair and recombination protein RAD54 and RAD54-like protein
LHQADKENLPPSGVQPQRIYGGTPQSLERLAKPFKCPGSAAPTRISNRPSRKRQKISYADHGGNGEEGDDLYTNEDRLALVTREANKYPVFKVKDKEATFRQRFSVPLLNKNDEGYDSLRPAPLLGMRQGKPFFAKPLHDPSGEFAIVLYDPTVEDKPVTKEEEQKKVEEGNVTKVDGPIVHKSLAEILGLKKKVEDRPRVPVVIDPRLAKVLRPHQVEGVKVSKTATLMIVMLTFAVLVSMYDRID